MAVAPVPTEQAPLLARPYYSGGQPGPIAGTLAHVPELLDVAMPFIASAVEPSAVPARLKEIAILRASALLRCRYCVQTHTVIALDAGLTRTQVEALRRPLSAEPAFADERELTLIAWVEAVVDERGAIDPALGERMAARFAAPEIVELTLTATATMMLNRYCTALELPTSAATLRRLDEEGLLS